MSEDLLKLNGKFTYILFRNEDNFYTVAKFLINDENEKSITVVGYFLDITLDIFYNIYGQYTENEKYGLQFTVNNYELPLPEEEDSIIKYLSGSQFPTIGKKTAQKVVECLGHDCLKEIKNNNDILDRVEGLSDKHKSVIIEGLNKTDEGFEDLIQFLNISGIGYRNLIRLNRTYGKEALKKLKENPYRVIEECDGFGFALADKIGKYLGISADDERRLFALLVQMVMDHCMASGDSYILEGDLVEKFNKATEEYNSDFEYLLNKAIEKNLLIKENNRIYPISQYDAEIYISNFLSTFPRIQLDNYKSQTIEQHLEAFGKEIGIVYDDIQKEAIHNFFDNDFLIITGGPGTGKTTIVRAITELYRNLYPASSFACLAPTGRAAKRLSELTDSDATTIHSLLKWDLESNTFGVNEDNPLLLDLLIIDEFSMVDQWLFYNLLKASGGVKKICIIGDEDQLPSVGPGAVFRDILETNLFKTIRLTKIYRQDSGSGVVSLSQDIRNGFIDESYSSDVLFYECNIESIKSNVQRIVNEALKKGYDLNDIQVLSPMHPGVGGIDVLNNALQEQFNPKEKGKKEIKIGYTTLREGDKILQLKNQPDDDVYNGDIGTLIEIIDKEESITGRTIVIVDFQGIIVEYNPDNFNNITLAYCISVHKSQGSEYPIVIIPFTYKMSIMLQRKLIYTGVTRAKSSLVILGELGAMQKGVSIIEKHPRATTLKNRIVSKMII